VLQKLYQYQEKILEKFNIDYKRYLYSKIDYNEKMIGIFGARGVGKTTLLLQKLIELQQDNIKVLYISLDYPFLTNIDLLELVDEFIKEGGEVLLLDEVHRYRDFSSYLKSIYDIYDLKIIFTGSSAISILNAKSDLSRRVTLYKLNGLSFREYLEIKTKKEFPFFKLEDILISHIELANKIEFEDNSFKEYLQYGYYPFYFDKYSSFYESLVNTINLTIDIDLPSLGLVEQKYSYKLKKLLEVICESKPFEVNYTKIAQLAQISRVKLYDYISYLNDSDLLLLIDENVKGIKKISKPAKIYLNNTNLLFAYCDSNEIGTIRETFFANQLKQNHKLNISKQGDFLIDNKYIFEIGGKNKSFKQIKDIKNSFVVADDIKIGNGNKIPLWMFGFLY
jgi:predicted AAA+ superfamily ATPase